MLAVPAVAQTGVLNLGDPVAAGDVVRVPVQLGGEVGNGVSAMDFRLNYDPAVFEPMEAAAGPALQSAGKLVEANVARPGEYAVLIFGMNQAGVAGGEVANIELRVIGEPAAGATELAITNTTLSLANAQRVPSRGSTRTVRFDEQAPSEPVDEALVTEPPPQSLSGGGGAADDLPLENAQVPGGGVSSAHGSERPGQPLEVVAKLVDKLREAEALRSNLPPGGRGAIEPADTGQPQGSPAEQSGGETTTLEGLASDSIPPGDLALAPQVKTADGLTASSESTAAEDISTVKPDATGNGRTKNVAVGIAVMATALLGALWGVRTILVR